MMIFEAMMLIRDLDKGRWPSVTCYDAHQWDGAILVDLKCGDYTYRAKTRQEAAAWIKGLDAGRRLASTEPEREIRRPNETVVSGG